MMTPIFAVYLLMLFTAGMFYGSVGLAGVLGGITVMNIWMAWEILDIIKGVKIQNEKF